MITSFHARAGFGPLQFDPLEQARQEAAGINARRDRITAGIDRVLGDAPWVERRALLADLVAYHHEAMERVPSAAKYPEAAPWVEYVRANEREVRRLAELTDEEIALVKSLGPYLKFRGFKQTGIQTAPPQTERCRTVFLPETDHGPFQIKNVDDPLGNWNPEEPLPVRAPRDEFWWANVQWVADGVGSGLHIDDEPEEIFPLPVLTMAGQHCGNTEEIVEFLRRYSPFWGGSNLLVYDQQYRTVAIEKCSHNFFETFGPNAQGACHVSGMACRDPQSPQARYQRRKRAEYRELYNLAADGVDATFWEFSDEGERMLAEGIAQLGPCPKVQDICELFVTPYPNGLCKGGYRFHPDQGVTEYTLLTYATLLEERRYLRWQRSLDGAYWPEQPEVCCYG
jgi:hypothetical protein